MTRTRLDLPNTLCLRRLIIATLPVWNARMTVPLLDLKDQHLDLLPQVLAKLEELIRSGKFVLGDYVEAFETQLAEYCGTAHAVGLSSGTDALLAAMMAMDIGPGDEVIVPTFTFFATAGCVSRLGATPVFVDIEPVSFNIDVTKIEDAITDKTKAIIPVHLFGQVAAMDAINEIACRHEISVIEDAAQAIGAADHGRKSGSIGRVGCLSFYPTKNLAAMGDAGACVTDDETLAAKIRQARLHGQTGTYQHAFIGGNFRIDAMQAVVLGLKLPKLDGWAEARRANAKRYDEALADLPITLPRELDDKYHVYNQYTIRSEQRDALRQHLLDSGVGCNVYYPLSLHMQPCFAYCGGKLGDCPVAERACHEVLSLPIFPELSDVQQDEVIEALRAFFRG